MFRAAVRPTRGRADVNADGLEIARGIGSSGEGGQTSAGAEAPHPLSGFLSGELKLKPAPGPRPAQKGWERKTNYHHYLTRTIYKMQG